MHTFTDLLNQQLSEIRELNPATIAFAAAMIGFVLMLAYMDQKGIEKLIEPLSKEGRAARRQRQEEAISNGR